MEEAAFWGDTGFFNELSCLTHCANPLVQGLSEPFAPEIMENDERRKSFIQSPLELTDAGRTVLAGEEDRATINSIDYWWGGTRISNQSLWRWDTESAVLKAPAQSDRNFH